MIVLDCVRCCHSPRSAPRRPVLQCSRSVRRHRSWRAPQLFEHDVVEVFAGWRQQTYHSAPGGFPGAPASVGGFCAGWIVIDEDHQLLDAGNRRQLGQMVARTRSPCRAHRSTAVDFARGGGERCLQSFTDEKMLCGRPYVDRTRIRIAAKCQSFDLATGECFGGERNSMNAGAGVSFDIAVKHQQAWLTHTVAAKWTPWMKPQYGLGVCR